MELNPQKEKPLSFSATLNYSYLLPVLPVILVAFLGKKQFTINIILIITYSVIFYFLLTYFEDLKKWVNHFEGLKGFYFSFYTFLEYLFFTSFIFFNILSRKLRKSIIYFSIGFIVFQFVYFLNYKLKNLDTIPIGVETILLFTYVIFYFYEQFKSVTGIPIYYHACFWVCVGILIYLGGSFFFFIMANHMAKTEIDHYWYLTFIGEIIKNVLFAFSVFLYIRQKKDSKLNKKILPNLDMV